MKTATEALSAAVAGLSRISGGGQESKPWHDGLDCKSWAKFASGAAPFIAEDLSALSASATVVQEALGSFEDARSMAGAADVTQLELDAEAAITRSQVTMKAQEIMKVLAGGQKEKDQRGAIRNALRALRKIGKNGTKEKDVLPPALLQKVEQALGKKG